jgi:hypothetical protein
VFSKPDFWSLLGAVPRVDGALRAAMAERLWEVAALPQAVLPAE